MTEPVLHCPRCEYEFRFDDDAGAPPRCPECGTLWIGALKKGRKQKSPKLVAAGIAIGLGATVLFNPIFYMGWLAPRLSTPVLFASMYAMPTDIHTVWDELAKRPLSPAWTRKMGERALGIRRSNQYESSPGQWFATMIAAGAMPPDLTERFYREGFAADLVVPAAVKVGEPFTARLRVKRVSGGGPQLGLMFAGYALDDGPAEHGRVTSTMWAHQLRPQVFSPPREVIPATLTIDRPGEVRVRAVFWVVYQPSFSDELTWQPDGTPATPTRAVWFQKIELEKTVLVE